MTLASRFRQENNHALSGHEMIDAVKVQLQRAKSAMGIILVLLRAAGSSGRDSRNI